VVNAAIALRDHKPPSGADSRPHCEAGPPQRRRVDPPWRASPARPSRSTLERRTFGRTKSALRSFFGFCVDSGYLRDNPPWLRARASQRTGHLFDCNRLILEILLGTGIRLGSLVALNIGDIDLKQGPSTSGPRAGVGTKSSSIPRSSACWPATSRMSPLKPSVAAMRPLFAADPAPGSPVARSSYGLPSCAGRRAFYPPQAGEAKCPSTPCGTPSPPTYTTRPGICT